jgi:hypothetical protein
MQNRALGRENRHALVSAQLGVLPHHAASSAIDLLKQLAAETHEQSVRELEAT